MTNRSRDVHKDVTLRDMRRHGDKKIFFEETNTRKFKMISRYQVLAAIALLTTILFYRTMAQVDGYTPGVDYPIYNSVPFGLTFTCGGKLPGYYADPEARCQVWHWCLPNGRQFSFLCPNGTVFSQTARVCDWWFKVDCNDSPRLYGINDDLYRDINGNRI
ncbi:U-scoloptoxin(01)-Er1a isoform X1 [Vespula pensylvanica]|uniref:U-scoloptoxin(01)-Er1a isoform X1 n=1 Tax=Vespula pensylvanica TaxID=30213 RepID=UPI001CBA0901|nr:U-scoloptoxin(01)-Er1a isoform X1 [Vespula pensylvanica]XP_050856434.1 U-scoloptoxin(01)-Er1a isoform X1 [Vespula vulgaris]